jgi:glyoxylase-like metal-dependent hydrolase (beta-lactamase superfamily II)
MEETAQFPVAADWFAATWVTARTMESLRTLDVDVVYPGHGWPFGRQRLRQIAGDYQRRRTA